MGNVICKHCGASISSFARTCEYCGMAVDKPSNSTQDFINNTIGMVDHATKTVDSVMSDEAGQNKAYGVLAYFGLLWLIPFFMKRDSKFVRFHLNQGLILIICNMATTFISRIASKFSIPVLSYVGILGIVWFVFFVMGVVHACKGEEKELPIIGQFSIIK